MKQLALGLVSVIGLVSVAMLAFAQSGGARAGAKAPDFMAAASDGKSRTLSALTKEGDLVLYFIKVGCPVNHRAAPFYKKIDDAYKGKANIVGVINGDVSEAKAWAKEYGAKFPILADENLKIIRAYGAVSSPWAVVVGQDGKVKKVLAGGAPANLAHVNTIAAKNAGVKVASLSFDGAPSGGG
jgi:peroxiredoxin Q/BCP